ncbi:MAG: hypothetical protein MUC83_16505, partial [Pirellula sp.]|nr:hypothetical protein [Pirellula sp.]
MKKTHIRLAKLLGNFVSMRSRWTSAGQAATVGIAIAWSSSITLAQEQPSDVDTKFSSSNQRLTPIG